MGPGTELDRNMIVKAIVDAFEPFEPVHAIWEGGSAAFDRMDGMSDIDLYIDVDDGHMDEVLPLVEKALEAVSPIEHAYHVPLPADSGYSHTFYRLERTSKFLLVDIAVIRHSSEQKFLEPEVHGEALVYLDRDGTVRVPSVDREALTKRLGARLGQLRDRFRLVDSFFEKELKRGNMMIAMDLYHRVVLGSLIELLRIKHRPFHHDFTVHQLQHDLPKDIYTRLEKFAFVKEKDDLKIKFDRVSEWFWKEIEAIGPEDIRRAMDR